MDYHVSMVVPRYTGSLVAAYICKTMALPVYHVPNLFWSRTRRRWRCGWLHRGVLYVEASLDELSWDSCATRLRVRRLFQVVRCVEHGRCEQVCDGKLYVKAPLDAHA
jgi:hypothetical protein